MCRSVRTFLTSETLQAGRTSSGVHQAHNPKWETGERMPESVTSIRSCCKIELLLLSWIVMLIVL